MEVKPRRRSFLPIYTEANETFEYPEDSQQGLGWLTELMDKTRAGNQSTWTEPRKTIRSSGAGDQCIRSLSLSFLGWNDVFTSRTLRIFDTGRNIELSILKELKDANILLGENVAVPFNLPIPIVGIYDAMVETPYTLEPIILELKSMNSGYFDKLPEPSFDTEENFTNLLKTQIGYLSQLYLYMYATGVHHGALLYESKNEQKRKVYELRFNQAFFDSILARLTEAWEYAQKGMVAPRTLDPSRDKVCLQCKKKDLCLLLNKNGATREMAVKTDQKLRG